MVLGCSPPARLWCDLVGSSRVDWLLRLRPRPRPRLLAFRPPVSRSSPRPGPSRSSAPPRAPRPAGCSLRARPRPTRLPTGTSPLSLRRTRKVRPRLTGLRGGGGSAGTPPPRSLDLPGGPPVTREGAGRRFHVGPPRGWVSGIWFTREPADMCKDFFLKCSASLLLKRVRDLRVRTKWGCVALLLIGKPFSLLRLLLAG